MPLHHPLGALTFKKKISGALAKQLFWGLAQHLFPEHFLFEKVFVLSIVKKKVGLSVCLFPEHFLLKKCSSCRWRKCRLVCSQKSFFKISLLSAARCPRICLFVCLFDPGGAGGGRELPLKSFTIKKTFPLTLS